MTLRIVSKNDQPVLPAWKAFVVQFSRESDGSGGTFAGRAEHLRSGRREPFASPQELIALFDRMLAEYTGR